MLIQLSHHLDVFHPYDEKHNFSIEILNMYFELISPMNLTIVNIHYLPTAFVHVFTKVVHLGCDLIYFTFTCA